MIKLIMICLILLDVNGVTPCFSFYNFIFRPASYVFPIIQKPTFNETQHPHIACTMFICRFPNEKSLRFFILGDWGGLAVKPYRTHVQKKIAKTMGEMGERNRTHFQLTLGDNIYMVGIKSATYWRVKKTFEKVYKKGSALYKPWYIMAGNHDHYGSVDAQIAYTVQSDRWAFPDYYYPIRYQINDTRIDIIMIDTIILCGNTREGKYRNFFQYLMAPASDRVTRGPKSKKAAEKHWKWIEDQLNQSTANYLFVAGHYPVYSTAEHGSTPCLVERLHPLLKKYNVSAYFCGHDHNLQHLSETFDDGREIHYIVSGSGAFEIMSNKNKHTVPNGSSLFMYPTEKYWPDFVPKSGYGNGGFVFAVVGKKEATFRYILGNEAEVHDFTILPRK